MKRRSESKDADDNDQATPPQRRRVTAPVTDESLQEAIKVGQRVSFEWKDAWHHWCDARAAQRQSVYDPAKYPADALTDFFRTMGGLYGQYYRGPPRDTRRGGGGPGPQMEHGYTSRRTGRQYEEDIADTLIEMVKCGQRQSPEWKEGWSAFCSEYAGGQNDPRKQAHNPVFFVAYCFRFGLSTLGTEPWAQPFLSAIAKAAMPVVVKAIKDGQRNSTAWKEAWGAFCDTKGIQFRDPSRHDAGSLLHFMDTVALAKFSTEPWVEPFISGSC